MKKLHLKLNLKSTLIWAAILGGITFLFMAVFPAMANESMQELANGKLDALPDALLAIVGFETIPDFTDIRVFYAYIMQYINIALSIFALSLGLSSFLKEEETGTIEFVYAQAISRKEFVIQKLLTNFLLVAAVVSIIVLGSTLSLILFIPADINLTVIIIETLPLFASYYALAFIFLMLGSGLSLILKSGSSINALSMGIVFISYIVGIVSTMVKVLNPLEGLSILHTLFPSSLYARNLNISSLIFWVITSLLIFILGMKRFEKRDILV